MSEMNDVVAALFAAADEVRKEAYAPYSGYHVGAAILDSNGRVWTGANVENVSYGATVCAERVAVFKMASAGAREISMLAVVTQDGGTPCGMCLQVLLEFARDPAKVRIIVANEARQIREFSLAELIPYGFSSDKVNRTEPRGS